MRRQNEKAEIDDGRDDGRDEKQDDERWREVTERDGLNEEWGSARFRQDLGLNGSDGAV